MNIIERIDGWLKEDPALLYYKFIFDDCKAEIERLTLANNILEATLQGYVTALDEAKEYTFMTDDELVLIVENAEKEAFRMGSYVTETGFEPYRAVEAEVIKRAGLVVKEKE